MSYALSTNIAQDQNKELDYIVTANARRVAAKILSDYSVGIHSFCLVGSYGTGKSSFILAFERALVSEYLGEYGRTDIRIAMRMGNVLGGGANCLTISHLESTES